MRLWAWILPSLLLSHALAHDQQRAPEIFHVSEGHLFILTCSPADQQTNVTWSREGRSLGVEAPEQSGSLGVEVQEGRLWFRPVRSTHSGVYTCHYRTQGGEYQAQMELSVSRGLCPFAAERRALARGVTNNVPCKLYHLYHSLNLSSSKNIRWMKGCAPQHRPGAPLRVDEWGGLWLPEVSSEDRGTYTCFIDVSVGGQNYSATWSVEVTVNNKSVFVDPTVVYPRDQVIQVELGGSVELPCLADLGYSEDDHTDMYWLLNHTHTDDHPGLSDSWHFVQEERRVQGVSTLLISEVHHAHLNVPIMCKVQTLVGEDQGCLWLTPVDPSAFHRALGCSVGLSLVLLLLAACVYCCRVELVLVYRNQRMRFSKHYVADEKLFDAVVSCLHCSGLVPPDLSLFSLQLLPQRLEQQWGYRLYIRGRDDCPGEAVHDALSEVVKRSRRLLLLLCASRPQAALQMSEELHPLCYEQRVGLYEALMHKEPRIILIEISGPVDYSCLPESVQYLRRTQGALQWRPRSRLGFLCTERIFWNSLHYHMPPMPSGRSHPGPRSFSPSSSVVVESELVKSKSQRSCLS
ncbi:interleukin-1 receptor type 1 [Eucyclogobius newberryi]|uniref:interleukin-1 receptor type 1 n=1 Tax=Eucyclogobius newberryi TaxID=166745 RepID=UPI003B5B5A00